MQTHHESTFLCHPLGFLGHDALRGVSVVANGLQPYRRPRGTGDISMAEVTETELIISLEALKRELDYARRELEVAASRYSDAERNLHQCSQKLFKLRGLQLDSLT